MRLSRRCEEIFSHPGKPLKDHLEKVGEMIFAILNSLSFSFPFPKKIFCEVGRLVGYYHDLGKATNFFQEYLNEQNPNKKAKLRNQKETNHSLLSAVATYFAVAELLKLEDFKENSDFLEFLPIASFLAVRRHHTGLEPAFEDVRLEDKMILQKQVDHLHTDPFNFLPHKEAVLEKLQSIPNSWPLQKITLLKWMHRNHGLLPHLIFYLLYSSLLDADKHEAALGKWPRRRKLFTDLVEKYRSAKGFDVPRNDIGILRNEIYAKILAQIENGELIGKRIFSLTAPTGAGKTLTVLDFALKLRERLEKERGFMPRIIYALPFLSIVDQNAKVVEDVIRSAGLKPSADLVLVHHHLSDYSYKTIEEEYGPDESEILVEGWDSEIIITTFVQFFHTLFTNRNRAIRKFNKIAGSIVILDEVQSFPHKYWLLFRQMAKVMARHLNTHFILVTATQPAIFEQIQELLPNKEQFFSSLNRYWVKVETKPQDLNDFSKRILERLRVSKRSTLIVLNTIKAAKLVFKAIGEKLQSSGFETYFLSSHIIPKERLRRIERIRNSPNPKVVISTQLVEAGVDIDLDWVVRDLGPFDSINQVAGRANRNQKSAKAEVEVVCLRDDNGRNFYSYIYDPFLIDTTRKILPEEAKIPESAFLSLGKLYFQEVKRRMSDDDSQGILQAVSNLNYDEVSRFQLIEEYDKVDIFVEVDEEASKIWRKFAELQEIGDFRERKKMFQSLKADFYQYVISVSTKRAAENLPPEVAGFRFISREQLAEFYDSETGFIEKRSYSAW